MPQTPLPSTRNGSPVSVNGYVEKAIRYVTDPRTGAQTIRTQHGPYNVLLANVPGFQNSGWATDLHCRNQEQGSPEWELIATIGLSWGATQIQDNPVAVWELISNKVEKDFLNAQNALVASLTQTDQAILKSYIDNPQFPAPTIATLSTTAPYSGLSTQGITAMTLILLGVTSQKIFQPVLKETQTTSNIYAIAASFDNVGQIISTATLSSSLPNALAFTMPPDPVNGKSGFAYGWLKNYPNVTVSAFNKTQIIQEYEFGLWNTTMYNVPI